MTGEGLSYYLLDFVCVGRQFVGLMREWRRLESNKPMGLNTFF